MSAADGAAPPGRDDARQRRLLVGLAVLFFAPIALAFYLYYGHSTLEPAGRVNKGDLIEPPRPLPALDLPLLPSGSTPPNFWSRKWTLLVVEPGPCGKACETALYETRQVRLSLNRDMDRVQRVLVAGAGCCEAQFLAGQHPDLSVVDYAGAADLLRTLPAPGAGAAPEPGRVFVVDPLGNLMMTYAPTASPEGMLKDMKRLLKLSHIG